MIWTIKRLIYFFFIAFFTYLMTSCGVYSFNGGSIGQAKTVNVKLFTNEAVNRNPLLAQNLTDKLRNKLIRETSLRLSNDSSDLVYEGTITAYVTSPVAISNDAATKTRLTVTARIRFRNKLDKEKNFEESMSSFDDFDASKTLQEVENQLIESINDRMVLQIFNKSINDW